MILAGCSKPLRSQQKNTAEKPNIIIFLPDALRADRLGCYGNDTPTSPIIDSFSKQGILFEKCYSQAPWTKPSIASLFTGFLPPIHQAIITEWDGVNPDELKVQLLRNRFTTLAESLQDIGYQTAFFTFNVHVQKQFGFAQGYNNYRCNPGDSVGLQMAHVINYIHSAKEPFFILVHARDPHGPYKPDDEFYRSLFGNSQMQDLKELNMNDSSIIDRFKDQYKVKEDKAPLNDLSEKGVKYLKQLYDAEIKGIDEQFGRLLKFIERHRIKNRTVLIVTSDHGEAFGEHGEFTHGLVLYDENIHVPLIIGGDPIDGGVRVPWSVAQFDLNPTLITLAGGVPISDMQARTLLSKEGDIAVKQDRQVFSYRDHYDDDMNTWDTSIVLGSRKVLTEENGKTIVALDTKNDPQEKINILPSDGTANEPLKTMLDDLINERENRIKVSMKYGEAEWTNSSNELLDELGALGYF